MYYVLHDVNRLTTQEMAMKIYVHFNIIHTHTHTHTTHHVIHINGKLKRSTKNLELDTNVVRNGNFAFFCSKQQTLLQTANSAVRHENLRAAEYCWP